MTAAMGLRVASLVALLQFAGHGWLFVRATPTHGGDEVAVIEMMKASRFDFMGSMRSYWDFYFGYGLEAAFICLVEAILFWQLATLAKSAPTSVRPMVALFILANVGHMILVGQFFFLTPLLIDGVLATCLAFAWLAPERRGARPRPSGTAGVRREI